MDEREELERELASLRAGYAAKLPERLAEIEHIWARVSGDGGHEIDLHTLRHRVHSLRGSGKVFGFAALSDVAHRLEERLVRMEQADVAAGGDERGPIQDLLVELRQAASLGGGQH